MLFETIITWLNKRKTLPPPGSRYCPIIITDEMEMLESSWSVDIAIGDYLDEKRCKASLKFLSNDAPVHLLKLGIDFKLFEGNNLVAVGKIIG